MSTPVGASPLVLLKAGQGPPIVITHGLAGTIQVTQLARSIQAPNPVYAIRAKGVDGAEEPLDRVEAMASYYTDAMNQCCPHDSYIVVGYSFGGLIALEMARRLRDSGKKILLLVMLDAYPHPHFLRLPTRIRLFFRRMTTHGQHMWQMPAREGWSYFLKGVKRRLHLRPAQEQPPSASSSSPRERVLYQVSEKAFQAYTEYEPRFYKGKVSFVTTATKTFFPTDPAAAWKHLVADLEVETVPGDHLNVVTTEFAALATLLTKYVLQISGCIEVSSPSL